MNTAVVPNELTELARKSMLEHHLEVDFPPGVLHQVETINEPAVREPSSHYKDFRDKLWFSLDNNDSKDLDQLSYAETLSQDKYKIYVAIADVDSLVKKNTPIDNFAQKNTTSVYTPTVIFPMLPLKLSTDLTSLNESVDRLAIVVAVEVNPDGSLGPYEIQQAIVNNKAKLAYNSVADWLDEKAPVPKPIENTPGMEQQVRLQDKIAALLRNYRHGQGSLTLETVEPVPEIVDDHIVDIKPMKENRARHLIEDVMIAANSSVALFLSQYDLPSLRRVVRIPKRWDRIMEIATERGETLPAEPDPKALDFFLIKERLMDPVRFADLSLTIIKLLGRGEYIVEYPNGPQVGHFSLAIKHYTHSTAPNRRYPDLITQRMIKAALEKKPSPYSPEELTTLARRCTDKEDEATKVERQMKKSASILLLSTELHQNFDAIVTGTGQKGTWVRILHPPVDGKLVAGYENVDVGNRIKVTLIHVDMEKGYIDFSRAKS